jgi:hypothetical protein
MDFSLHPISQASLSIQYCCEKSFFTTDIKDSLFLTDCLSIVWIIMLLWRSVNMIPDQVRAKTVKLVFVASLLCISQRLIGLDWGICIRVEIYVYPADICLDELALWKKQCRLSLWYNWITITHSLIMWKEQYITVYNHTIFNEGMDDTNVIK